jgi:hypothetical protein
MAIVDLTDRSAIERRIAGALTAAIDAHGPIVRRNVSSGAKRVYSELKAASRETPIVDVDAAIARLHRALVRLSAIDNHPDEPCAPSLATERQLVAEALAALGYAHRERNADA